ncbi:hypothetical protein [Micromonospora sp. NPDC002717]|uniref:hypothetical protein n=1 Tax=Micromonospora sp. NPDC002717 TaxID=3154424 RepID=UPI003327CD0D
MTEQTADPRVVTNMSPLRDGRYALSSTLGTAPWERTTIIDKPTAEVATDLKATESGDIPCCGRAL